MIEWVKLSVRDCAISLPSKFLGSVPAAGDMTWQVQLILAVESEAACIEHPSFGL